MEIEYCDICGKEVCWERESSDMPGEYDVCDECERHICSNCSVVEDETPICKDCSGRNK